MMMMPNRLAVLLLIVLLWCLSPMSGAPDDAVSTFWSSPIVALPVLLVGAWICYFVISLFYPQGQIRIMTEGPNP